LLSSAILYVAIVVIWAGVLIPRWLRRDSSDTAAAAAERSEAEAAAALEFAAGSASGAGPGSAAAHSGDSGVEPARVPGTGARRRREPVPDEPLAGDPVAADPLAGDPVAADPGHRRVLAARRRLLIMLVTLSVASGVLAETRMAAWWVIVPPSVMLLGYLLLLREAAKADTERREMARYRMDREAAERRSAPVAHVVPVAAAVPVAAGPVAPVAGPVAPAAKIIAFLPPPEEQIYDQYTDAKRRAVGDLRIPARSAVASREQFGGLPNDVVAATTRTGRNARN
jgi:hypothetical protein